MLKSHFPDITPERITSQVRRSSELFSRMKDEELPNDAPAPATEASLDDFTRPVNEVTPLILQPDFLLRRDERYHVNDLLGYHDRHFVQNTYLALLKRAPTPAELEEQLQALRGGRVNKLEMIESLRASDEWRAGGVRLEGIGGGGRRASSRLNRLPVLGYALRVVKAVLRLPVRMEHQQQFEGYALGQQQRIAEHVNYVSGRLTRQLDELRAAAEGQVAETTRTNNAVTNLSDHVAQLDSRTEGIAESLAAASQSLREMSVGLSGGAADVARLTSQVAEVNAELTDFSEAVVMLARALAELTASSAELSVPKSLALKQREIEALAQSLAESHREQAAALRELIVQEQFAIVEAQKAALAGMQSQLDEMRQPPQPAVGDRG